MSKRWNAKKANDWFNARPWMVGCNYSPRNAINQLEMWQKETFSPQMIREELGWAKSLGFNTARIFLHDLAWAADSKGFFKRVDQVLSIAARSGIGVMLVIFDSCWHPFPHVGPQPQPEPGVHNSGWLQSPGIAVLNDEQRFDALKKYVVDVVSRYRTDERVQIWDVWNEPDNPNFLSYGPRDLGWDGKAAIAGKYLQRVFDWVRSANPTQPLTSGPWLGDWASEQTIKGHEKIQFENSDLISFHCYGDAADMERRIEQLKRYGRPILCTEYMSRGSGSTFETVMPVLKKHRVGAYNWGFVAGKTQTNYPWDSWQRPYEKEPDPWFHDIFRGDGSPYRQNEVDLIRSLTGKAKGQNAAPTSPRQTKKKASA